jgi:hypothetical protein
MPPQSQAARYTTNGTIVALITDMKTRRVVSAVLTASLLLARTGSTQTIPVPGGEGTLGLDGTIDKFYKATHHALVTTADGVHHLVHVNERTVVHGSGEATDPLASLEPGSHVAVHYLLKGDSKEAVEIDRIGKDGLSVIDGNVVDINRARKEIRIALDSGKQVSLRLTDRAAQDVGKDVRVTAQVIVFYSDDGSGDLVAHYFKKAR